MIDWFLALCLGIIVGALLLIFGVLNQHLPTLVKAVGVLQLELDTMKPVPLWYDQQNNVTWARVTFPDGDYVTIRVEGDKTRPKRK